ncbi:MAG: UDP-N-acetylmuramoyl-L-alanyl-D-glutamate--2,6-diaminopimelate ligase [Calditrichaeota bacterium]|nr:UDP-N-acetylmuramoyl-L-alanyl-D-glutamate--2,6-diaminopimelate ligase [Calditrichota bacterium]
MMKRVSDILRNVPVREVRGDTARMIADIQYDSRRVRPEDAFIAIRGFRTDGHRFVSQAYEKGCRVFFVEEPQSLREATQIILPDTRRWLPLLAKNFYDGVVDHMKLIGITGTNGKTTTAYLLHSILTTAHWRPGFISTVEYKIGEETIPAERTTPEAIDLHRMFYRMYARGIKSVVMEVSSHALALHRTDFMNFSAAVFTNLGHDHLDFHKDMDDYFRAKKKLFDGLSEMARAVVNLDDAYGLPMVADTEADVFTYSLENREATVSLKTYRVVGEGLYLTINVPSGDISLSTALIGKYNVYNVLAAVTTAVALGIPEEHIVEGVQRLQQVPGRAQKWVAPQGFKVYVDYAHAPDALRRVLEALLEFQPRRLIVVFGCGGDRDRAKRPMMGKIAEDYADIIYLTSDNPRSEDPEAIIQEILQGIYDRSRVRVEPDREAAIRQALKEARKGDIVLIAGKGHETYQIYGDRYIHFDDREMVEKYLSLRD